MKITDIISLAKMGYSPDDVREFLKEESSNTVALDTQAVEVPTTEPIADVQVNDDAVKEEPKQPDVDYKALYEEEQKKVQDLQRANVNTNMSGTEEDSEELLISAISRFL